MLEEISYALIFGRPLIFYIGIITFLSLASTATAGILVMRGSQKITMKQHVWMARITLVIASLHGLLGILHYF